METDGGRDCALHLRAMGQRVRVDFEGSRASLLRDEASRAWSRCIGVDSDEPDVRLRVLVDDEAGVVREPLPAGVIAGHDPAQLMDALSPLITIGAIGALAGQVLMLHAGAVADPTTGRTLALVGPSGAGKTTATRVLAQKWGYVTDETLAVRDDLTIAPYPKPLSLRVADQPYKEQADVDDLGLQPTPADCHLHRVVLLARDDSPEPWLEPVSTVRALALLAPETSYLARLESPLHRLAAALGPRGLRTLHYREADQLPAVVEQLLEED